LSHNKKINKHISASIKQEEVKDFPAVVIIDLKGNNLYEEVLIYH